MICSKIWGIPSFGLGRVSACFPNSHLADIGSSRVRAKVDASRKTKTGTHWGVRGEWKMMTNTERRERWGPSVLSGDLRRTLGEQGLLRLALDAIQALDLRPLLSEGGLPAGFRPQMMLTLLTYCY